MTSRGILRPIVLGATLLAAAPVRPDVPAEEDPQTPAPEFEERVQVREPLPDDVDPAAFHTTIDARELSARGRDLADALRRVPGARVRDYGGLGSYATVSVRASTAEQVRVLVDGVPQNRALGGPVDLSSIPATQIEEVRVYRGFAPTSLGAGAVGGVIDVRTRRAGGDPSVDVDLLAGEFDTRRASASISIPNGRNRGLRIDAESLVGDGNFLFLDTGGTYFVSDDDSLVRRRNADVDDQALTLQQVWEDLSGDRLRISFRLRERERGLPWVDNLPTETARSDDRQTDLTITWQRGAPADGPETRVVVDAFDQALRFADPDSNFGRKTGLHTDMTGAGASGVVRIPLGRHRLQMRLDLRYERVEQRDDLSPVAVDQGGSERTTLGLSLEDVFAAGRWMVAPSVRWDQRDESFIPAGAGTLPPPADDVREDSWSGKLGVSFAVDAATTIRGSIGSFFRAPNLIELFGDRGSLRGNPELRAERGLAAEIGVLRRHSGENVAGSVELVGFARWTDDMIHFRQQSQGIAVATNLVETVAYGIESALTASWRRTLHADLGLTWQPARDRSGAPNDGEPLIYHPDWLGYLGLRWERDGWYAGWEMTYTGENSTDPFDLPQLRLEERILHDFVAGHTWPSGLELSIDVRNGFDRRTRDVARYPLPDRVAFVHVGWHEGARR